MSASLSHNRTRFALLAAAFAVVAIVASLLVLAGNGAEDEGTLIPSGPRQLMDIFDPNEPLMLSGEETTLLDVVALASFPIHTPQDAADASPEVWFSADTGEVALRYGTDLVVLLAPWPTANTNSAANPYDAQASEMGVGYTTMMNEHPAWVLPSDGDAEGEGSVSVVHLMIDGVDVTLYGTMSVEELVKLAESV